MIGGCRLLSGRFSSFWTGNADRGPGSVQIWRSGGSEWWHLGEWEFSSSFGILIGVLRIETDQRKEGGHVWWLDAVLHLCTDLLPEDRSNRQEGFEIEEGRRGASRHGEDE